MAAEEVYPELDTIRVVLTRIMVEKGPAVPLRNAWTSGSCPSSVPHHPLPRVS
jgi:hypothetical protein